MHHDNCQHSFSTTMTSERPTLKLASSASEQNAYFTYLCLVNDNAKDFLHGRPSTNLQINDEDDPDDQPIQVERTKALHELIDTHKTTDVLLENITDLRHEIESTTPYPTTTSGEDSDISENDEFICFDSPNILKLTKMKWLSEGAGGSPDSSSPVLSPVISTSSVCSRESQEDPLMRDKYLSTILRLDKEHNLFGLSSIAIVGTKLSRNIRKEDIKPVFPQTAIVQICCAKGCEDCRRQCCRYKTNTDLPPSLKCGGCRSCVNCDGSMYCSSCGIRPPYEPLPCKSSCSSCSRGLCRYPYPCLPAPRCSTDCNSFGLKIALHRKPKYEPFYAEVTPRASCVLQKPVAARSCHHTPKCVPPSSCFPYLMPCFWPSRASAPCTNPERCFHNPPCLPARKRSYIPASERCPLEKLCDYSKNQCPNIACPGKNKEFRQIIETRYGGAGAKIKSISK